MKNLFLTSIAICLLTACAATNSSLYSDEDSMINISANASPKRKLVLELLNLFNAKKQSQAVLNSMIETMPTDVRDTLRSAFDADEMIEIIAPVYEKYLTEDELKTVIKFYKSPVGRKLLAAQPKIMNDSIIVMKVYAQNKIKKILKAEKENTGKLRVK